jgi:excisionase family DNA binding protein
MTEGTTTRPSRPLTVGQVAERLGCSVDKVYELLDDEQLPGARRLDPRKPKSPWRIPPAAVELYLARR